MDWGRLPVVSPSGASLAVSVAFPEGQGQTPLPWALLLHGFSSRGFNENNKVLAPRLLTRNIAVVVADLSGHGESGGSTADQTIVRAAGEIRSIIDTCKATSWGQSARYGLLGSSFSGSAAIINAASTEDLSCLALKSPVPDYEHMEREWVGAAAMKAWERDGTITLPSGVESRFDLIRDARSVNLFELVPNIKAPTLMVQGSADELIPQEDWRRLSEAVRKKGGQVVIVPGADHRYTTPTAFAQMLDALETFIVSELAPPIAPPVN